MEQEDHKPFLLPITQRYIFFQKLFPFQPAYVLRKCFLKEKTRHKTSLSTTESSFSLFSIETAELLLFFAFLY